MSFDSNIKSQIGQITQKLFHVHEQIEQLKLPISTYAVITIDNGKLKISELGGETTTFTHHLSKDEDIITNIIELLKLRALDHNLKFIAVEINAEPRFKSIISRLWLDEDIVPYFVDKTSQTHESKVTDIADRFGEDNIIDVALTSDNEVNVAELVTLKDYQNITDPKEFDLLVRLAKKLDGHMISFINATPSGGGVALMRHALIRLFRLLGVNAHWYVLHARKEAFDITKIKFHNVLQGVADEKTVLTEEEKRTYDEWMFENAEKFEPVFKQSDIIVIDDPQPCGLIPYIKKTNPKCKIVYRSHIQIVSSLIDKKGSPQSITWKFLWEKIKLADLFIAHPIPSFIPSNVPKEKVIMMPATTDPLDGLNKRMIEKQIQYYLRLFDKKFFQAGQKILDYTRPYIIQIARFDPSKGIPDVFESYFLLRKKLEQDHTVIPQLVLVGNGSIDDPDSTPLLRLTMELLQTPEYAPIADDVKVIRLPNFDQLLNALLAKSIIALQLSHKEGFEVKVTEALMKGIPIIAYKAGGIPLQIKHGVNGFLTDVGDTYAVADYLYNLITDKALYEKIKKNTKESIDSQTTTTSAAISWLYIASQLLEKGSINGNAKNIKDLINTA